MAEFTEKKFDYIVVGSGAAGSLVAERLSRDPSKSVVIVEAGGEAPPEHIHSYNFIEMYAAHPECLWDMYCPQQQLANREIDGRMGKMLGGSSAHNATMWVRGHRTDYDKWEATGATGWNAKSMWETFAKLEACERDDMEWDSERGREGPIRITANKPAQGGVPEAMRDAYGLLGLPEGDYNGDSQLKCGLQQYNLAKESTEDGGTLLRRQDAYHVFIEPHLHSRPNLTVKSRLEVTKVLFDGNKKAVGIQAQDSNGDCIEIIANKEVILCAGAINSPKLLMLSGVGARGHLRHHGIDLVHELPGVGMNLQDHLFGVMSHLMHEELPYQPAGYHSAYCSFSRFDKRAERGLPPQLQLFHVLSKEPLAGIPVSGGKMACTAVCLVQPRSRGYIRLRSASPTDRPLIDPQYLSHPTDLHDIVRGIERCRHLMLGSGYANTSCGTESSVSEGEAAWPMAKFVAGEVFPGLNVVSMGPDYTSPSPTSPATAETVGKEGEKRGPDGEEENVGGEEETATLPPSAPTPADAPTADAVTATATASPPEPLPLPLPQSLEEFIRGPTGFSSMWHPVGTCRMGPCPGATSNLGGVVGGREDNREGYDPIYNVVDPTTMKVHGLAGIRVIDASVMPCITSGNTHAPTLAIAYRGAEMVVADGGVQ